MKRTINKAAVIGAGVMGSGIAALLAGVGVQVLLLDIIPALGDGDKAKGVGESDPAYRNSLATNAIKNLANPKMPVLFDAAQADLITPGNIEDDLPKIADCDWVVEVISERLDLKQALFERVNQYRKPGSIVSTNTSGVSVTAIAEKMPLEFKQHFLGTHFFNPPRYMRLFEMIPLAETLPEVLDFMADYAENVLGKGVVVAKDTPNFIGNRIGVFSSASVIKLMKKYGYDPVKVDQLTGVVLGRPKVATFGLMDMVGLDIFSAVYGNLFKNLPEGAEKDFFEVPDFVAAMVQEGALGNKTKKGFYTNSFEGGKKTKLARNLATGDYEPFVFEVPEVVAKVKKEDNPLAAFLYGDAEENRFAWEVIRDLLLYCAAKVPEIADDFRSIDRAMELGYNWEKGPFALWDTIGLARSVDKMKQEGAAVPAWVLDKLSRGEQSFYAPDDAQSQYIKFAEPASEKLFDNSDASVWHIGDDVLCVEFHSRGNALSHKAVEMLVTATDALNTGKWAGMVIGNRGKFFSAGANLAEIAQFVLNNDWDGLTNEIGMLHAALMGIKYAVKPVVSAPFGMTLGGGAEAVMHSAEAVPFIELNMGLVEAGVGLIPGGGGCKESLIRVRERCDDDKPATLLPAVLKVWQRIAMAEVSTSAYDAVTKGILRRPDRVIMNTDALIDAAKTRVLQLAEKGYTPPVKRNITVLGDFGMAPMQFRIAAMKDGGFISEHDAYIAKKLAYVMTGGNVVSKTKVSEEYLLDLEKEGFASLCGEPKTQERVKHMLATGKPLRN